MGYPLFFGCLFIAYGPTAAIFALSIARSPQLVILCIGSSFFWLLSLLASSILWYVIPPLQSWYWWTVFWSVLFQELMRALFLKLYQRAEYDLVASAKTSQLTAHPDILKAALAIGLGVGGTQALVNYVTVLWQAMGEGSYYAPSCPSANLFILSAIYALCFTLLHIFWAILSMLAYRLAYYRRLAGIGLLHLVASVLTLLNLPGGHCAATLVLLPLFVAGVGYLTYFSVVRSTTLTVSSTLVRGPLRRKKKVAKKPEEAPAATETPSSKDEEAAQASATDPRAQDPPATSVSSSKAHEPSPSPPASLSHSAHETRNTNSAQLRHRQKPAAGEEAHSSAVISADVGQEGEGEPSQAKEPSLPNSIP